MDTMSTKRYSGNGLTGSDEVTMLLMQGMQGQIELPMSRCPDTPYHTEFGIPGTWEVGSSEAMKETTICNDAGGQSRQISIKHGKKKRQHVGGPDIPFENVGQGQAKKYQAMADDNGW